MPKSGLLDLPRELDDLTEEEKKTLDDWLRLRCRNLGYRAFKKTNGMLNAKEVETDILSNMYLWQKRMLEKDKGYDGPPRNLGAYFNHATWTAYLKIMDKFWDVRHGDQIGAQIVNDLEPDQDEVRMDKELAGHIANIEKAAKLLKIEIDPTDWVKSAQQVIAEGVHKYKLEGKLFYELSELGRSLAKNGHEISVTQAKKKKSGGAVLNLSAKELEEEARKLIAEDNLISVRDIMDRFNSRKLNYSSAMAYNAIRKVRSDLQIDSARSRQRRRTDGKNSIAEELRRMVADGVTDIKDATQSLLHKGYVFKPSYVRNIFNTIKKHGSIKSQAAQEREKERVSLGLSRDAYRALRKGEKVEISEEQAERLRQRRRDWERRRAERPGWESEYRNFRSERPYENNDERSAKGIKDIIRNLLTLNPEITHLEIIRYLNDNQIRYNAVSARVMICGIRKELGIPFQKTPLLRDTVRALMESGITSEKEICEKLAEYGLEFKLNSVYKYIYEARGRTNPVAPYQS